jgi:hypothetical protein
MSETEFTSASSTEFADARRRRRVKTDLENSLALEKMRLTWLDETG